MCVVGNGMVFLYIFSYILRILESILKALSYFQTYFINRDNSENRTAFCIFSITIIS